MQGWQPEGSAGEVRWDEFRLDLAGYRLEKGGVPVALEPKALDVLRLLVDRPGRLVTKQEIFDSVWRDTAVTDHALTRVIAQLRRALGDDSREARYIETVPTKGYRWIRSLKGGAPEGAPPPAVFVNPPLASIAHVASDGASIAPRDARRPRRLVLGGAALIIAAAAVTVAWFGLRPPVAPTASPAPLHPYRAAVAWPVQVTTHGGLDFDPALSPKGDALAFASDRSGALEIYVRPLVDGATDVPLTSNGEHNVQPAWSPDGAHLAFHSARRGGIWVVPARGGLPRQVAVTGSRPAWSPDGRQIAFQSDEHPDITPSGFGATTGSVLWVVGVDGQGARPLTRSGSPRGGHASPAWSPDGHYIGFTVFDGAPDNGAWVLDVSTGKTSRLTSQRKIYELAFAPDSSAVFGAGGDPLLFRIPFDAARGQAAGPLDVLAVAGASAVRGLSMAHDGSRIAFASLVLTSQIWAQPLTQTAEPSAPPRALTDDTSRRNSMAVISHDGSRVAYMSQRRGEPPNVWVMNVDGTGKRQLTSDRSAEGKPVWLEDGHRIAYYSNRDESDGFWAVDVNTLREEPLLDLHDRGRQLFALGYPAELALAPSMTRLALALLAPPDGKRRLYVTPLDRFAPRALTDGTLSAGYPAWSPDERRLAIELKDGVSTQAAVVDVETGELVRLTELPGQTWVRSWSPDGSRIAVAVLRGRRWSLQWIDVATKRQGIILPPEPPNVYVRYPEWSPRNDVMVFERGELRGNIWTMPLR